MCDDVLIVLKATWAIGSHLSSAIDFQINRPLARSSSAFGDLSWTNWAESTELSQLSLINRAEPTPPTAMLINKVCVI